jgi:hypothetical protein
MERKFPAVIEMETHDVPHAITDEELFEAYLAARLVQAVESMNGARDELNAQPNDFNRALAVLRKVHELRELQAQLDSQRGRVRAARAAAGIETAPTTEPTQVHPTIPGDAFRGAQAEQAERVMAALAARPRTCPSCQALLSANATRCSCGYTISAEPTIASPQPHATLR